MKKLSLLLLLFMFIPNSCYYIDTESYEFEVETSYFPIAKFSSNLDAIDSIVVADSIFFKYTIDIDTGKLYFADLYLDNYQIFRSDSIVDSLWIFPYFITEPGEFDLTLVAYYKTYSGSLADLVNAEFFIADTSWTLVLNSDNLP